MRLAPPPEGVWSALNWLLGQQQPDGGWGNPAVPHTRDVPTPAPTSSTTCRGSSPAFMPSTMASAEATLWIATSRLATYFMRLPLP